MKQKSRAGDNDLRVTSDTFYTFSFDSFLMRRMWNRVALSDAGNQCLSAFKSFHGASGEFIIAVLSPYPIHSLPPGAGLTMTPKLSVPLLLLLAVATVSVLAQRRRPTATTTDEWNYRDGCEHPDYSLFTLGQRWSSGLIMMMSKGEVKDDTATSLPLCFYVKLDGSHWDLGCVR